MKKTVIGVIAAFCLIGMLPTIQTQAEKTKVVEEKENRIIINSVMEIIPNPNITIRKDGTALRVEASIYCNEVSTIAITLNIMRKKYDNWELISTTSTSVLALHGSAQRTVQNENGGQYQAIARFKVNQQQIVEIRSKIIN
ncbi:MAG: hypothetical protein RSC69_06990 [Lachnospiraceae bacterium]